MGRNVIPVSLTGAGTYISIGNGQVITVDSITESDVSDLGTTVTIASSGAGPPTGITPDKVGDIYIDTTADLIYISTDTTADTDWDQLGVAGSGIDSIVEDDSPQLGGDLDLNGNVITGMVIGTDIQAWSAVLDATTASFTTADETKLDAISGTNTGDQTITLTGDVTGTGTGSFAATIAADSVTMDKIVDIATDTFLGRVTASTGTVEVLTNAQAKTALDISGTNTGDQTITLTGDVTGTGTGSFAATIGAGVVDLAMLSATGTPDGTKFLRGDNVWAVPAGSGDVAKVGTPVNDQVGVWTGDGTIEGTAGFTFDSVTDTLSVGVSGGIAFGAVVVLSDSSGSTTLQNIDAIDSTTKTTFESTIDTLSSLTTVGTIGTGVWQGTAIGDSYISSAATWDAKQDALTFGIADGNAVDIDSGASIVANDYVKFTATGLIGQTYAEVRADINVADGADVTNATTVAAAGGSIVSSGSGEPTSTPDKVGDIYIDTTADTVYIATDNASSDDWDQLGIAGSGIDSVAEDPTPQLGGPLDGQGEDLNNLGVVFMTEQGAAEADVGGKGQWWVHDDSPNTPMFTGDTGIDRVLSEGEPVIRNLTQNKEYLPADKTVATTHWDALVLALDTDVADGDVIETENISADCGASTLNIGNSVPMSVKWEAKNTTIQRSGGSDRMIQWAGGDGNVLEVTGLNLDLGESVRGASNWSSYRGEGFGPDATTGTVILRDCHFYGGPASHGGDQANLAMYCENYYVYNCRFTDPGSFTTTGDVVGKCARVKASRYVEMHGCTFDILTDHGAQTRWFTASNTEGWSDQTIKIFGGTMRADVGSTKVTCVVDTGGNGPASLLVDGLTIVNEGTYTGEGKGFMKLEGYNTEAVFQNVVHYGENQDIFPTFLNLSGGTCNVTIRNCKAAGTFYIPNTLNKLHIYDSQFGLSPDNKEVEELTLYVAPGTPWAYGDVITGAVSGCTATVIRQVSTYVYKIKGRSGTWKNGESISGANQSAGYPQTRGWIYDCCGGAGTYNSTAHRVKDFYLESTSFHGLVSASALWQSKDRPSWNPGHQIRYKNLTLLWNKDDASSYVMGNIDKCTSFAGTGLFIDNISPLVNYHSRIANTDFQRITCNAMDDTGLVLAFGKQVEKRYDKITTTGIPTPQPFQMGDVICGEDSDAVFRIVERKSDTIYQIDRLTGDFTADEDLQTVEYLVLSDAPGGGGWAVGDTITGKTSGETSVIVEVLSTTTYYIRDRSGDYDDGEILWDGVDEADQDPGYPIVTTKSVDGVVNSSTLSAHTDYENMSPDYGTNDDDFEQTPPASWGTSIKGVFGARIVNLDPGNPYHQGEWAYDVATGTWPEVFPEPTAYAEGDTPLDTDVSDWVNGTSGKVVGTGGRVWHAFKNGTDVYYVELNAN